MSPKAMCGGPTSTSTCQSNQDSPAVVPLQPWAWSAKPWQRIHIDFAGLSKLWTPTQSDPKSTRCPQQHPLLPSMCYVICLPHMACHVNWSRTMVHSFALRSLPFSSKKRCEEHPKRTMSSCLQWLSGTIRQNLNRL